jgi:hypothetical protein
MIARLLVFFCIRSTGVFCHIVFTQAGLGVLIALC